MSSLRNCRGQGLIEYLILVALVAVASIALVRILQTSINAQLANVVNALEGGDGEQHRHHGERVTDDMLRKKDFSDFLNGAVSR